MTFTEQSRPATPTAPAGRVVELGHPWRGVGPFLFAAHHVDAYPAGNEQMGPAAGIADRELGSDFGHPSGWNMYHGRTVPGFPAHPHRGFETITIVRRGVVDHADSTGASARYGDGDVQWVTAGRGVSHSEMFPLLDTDSDNPFELCQIWLNLPARDKTADPEFTMQWREDIPVVTRGEDGSRAVVRVIAGRFDDATALAPPTHSWAADPASDVAIWLVDLEPGAVIDLPAADAGTARLLYVHGTGAGVEIDGVAVGSGQGFEQSRKAALHVVNGDSPATILVLQGAEIGEPVVQYGPFVMNSAEEIQQAFDDYRRTGFGGWPWPSDAPVHARSETRFARYPDGRVERPRH
ncbi:Quercetin 2,3-dioxygenase [Gordonia paraffinivorans]|uniref:Quercetin 2,3-dioxygenase n=1 Tax=Gordonia paraffinivorans TaxID=175628 RepID=A0ABD7V2T8_9ACTN|nr:pirin family protein [Gordonia paraffinivorans]VFA88514.1 Quercetin 2,3-dioxygenase [Gordonia paraffinivorans]